MDTEARRALTDRIKARASALGFAGAGVAAAGPALSHGFYTEWLAEGSAGTMDYLHRHAGAKADPRRLLPEAKSLLLVSFNYQAGTVPQPPGLRGRVARFAWGADYHDVMQARLGHLAEAMAAEAGHPVRSRAFVDTAPVLERDWAARAGLGWIGKHGNLIHWRHGSWLFLGGLMTDLDLEPDAPGDAVPEAVASAARGLSLDALRMQEGCGACRICIDACPTGAIVADKTVDARRCIAYLNNELKGPVPKELRPLTGTWVFGCDICQDVCPWNRSAPQTGEKEFSGTPERVWPDLIGLLQLDDPSFKRTFKGTTVTRAKRRGLLRSAALALGNRLAEPESGTAPATPDERTAALKALIQALSDPEPIVRGAAAWALGRAGFTEAAAALTEKAAGESDPQVRVELDDAMATLAAVAGPGNG